MSVNEVKSYYNNIATDYDKSRFENSYGNFIDRQERKFLTQQLKKTGAVLSLGCGTGRFMEFATCGVDFSDEMLQIAKKNFPTKDFYLASANNLPFEDNSLDAVFCFHVVMHLPKAYFKEILIELYRVLKPGGQLIFDFPSVKRQKKIRPREKSWHGASAYSKEEIKNEIAGKFTLNKFSGIIFFPIHRVPSKLRFLFYPFDQLLNRSGLNSYSSYIVFSGCKKAK